MKNLEELRVAAERLWGRVTQSTHDTVKAMISAQIIEIQNVATDLVRQETIPSSKKDQAALDTLVERAMNELKVIFWKETQPNPAKDPLSQWLVATNRLDLLDYLQRTS